MDWDLVYDNMFDNIGSFTGIFDFRAELQKTALRCANRLCLIQEEWNVMLSSILSNWDADVKMSLIEAVDYMMSISGYDYLGEEPLFSDKSDFWFQQSELYKDLGLDKSKNKRLYYVTIAIFETINYWCWYDAPVHITFDSDGLKEVLKYGNIAIDWNSYEIFNGGDSSLH